MNALNLTAIRCTNVYPHWDCGVYDIPERAAAMHAHLAQAFPACDFESIPTTEFFPSGVVMPDAAVIAAMMQFNEKSD
jgi:hypothetical protein